MTKLLISSIVVFLAASAPVLASPPQRPNAMRVAFFAPGTSYLGIGVAEIDTQRAKQLKLKEVRGVEVKSVEPGSPAAIAGLKQGDVVLEYNGEKVEGIEQFIRLVHETPAGREVTLVVSRDGTTHNLTATIGTRSRGLVWRGDSGDFTISIPPVPPIPPMPQIGSLDLPRAMVAWRSSMLGVESESLSPQLAEFFGVKEGVLVRSVVRNSAAEKAGIKAGDVIVKVGDTKVTGPREVTTALRALGSKKTFPIVVVRKQQQLTLSVTLEDQSGTQGIWPVSLTDNVC